MQKTQTKKSNQLSVIDIAKGKFEMACKEAQSLQIVDNFGAAFTAVSVIKLLREAMTDEVMKEVFLPLMNTKVGFLTDRTGKPNRAGNVKPLYSVNIVRDAIIDAVSIGLLPTGNQLNIIAERMYPTKEGYTYLLKKLGCKYFINIGTPVINENTADINCKINYEFNGEKNNFLIVANVKKDAYSSFDQLKGKAERRAKKALYEFLTGCDFGDADETSSTTIDVTSRNVVDAEIIEQTEPTEQAGQKTVNLSDI